MTPKGTQTVRVSATGAVTAPDGRRIRAVGLLPGEARVLARVIVDRVTRGETNKREARRCA